MICLPNSRGWVVAPTYATTEKVFREVYKSVHMPKLRPHVEDGTSDYKKTIKLDNGAELYGKSCVEPEGLLGETLDYMIIDEAARIPVEVWDEYLTPPLATKLGWVALITTPYGKNWVYELFMRGQIEDDMVKSWQYPSVVSPYVPPEEVEMHRHSDPERIFKQNWLAEFVSGGGEVFRNLMGIEDSSIALSKIPIPGTKYFIGADFAKQFDFTVFVVMNQRGQIVYIERYQKVDYNEQLDDLVALAEHWNDATVWIDATPPGGDPIFDFLKLRHINVNGFVITNRSKIDLIESLMISIERSRLRVPNWKSHENLRILMHELEVFESQLTNSGNIVYSAPDGYHDDSVIALALAVWGWMQTVNVQVPDAAWDISAIDDGLTTSFGQFHRVHKEPTENELYRIGNRRRERK
jgi:hypothetical protein